MQAGKHKNVKIIGAFLGESKEKKTPYFGIEFQNQDGETIEHAFYLTEKTQDRQIETLAKMGYKGKSISDMANPKLKISDLFNAPVEPIELAVIEEEYTTEDGEIKTKTVVQWVNIGSKGGLSKLDHGAAMVLFQSKAFDGLLMQKRKEIPQVQTQNQEQDEIPF